MSSNSKLYKILKATLKHFVILLALFLRPISKAEETSILADATVIGSFIYDDICPEP